MKKNNTLVKVDVGTLFNLIFLLGLSLGLFLGLFLKFFWGLF